MTDNSLARSRSGGWRRLLRWAVLLVVVFLALPYLLTPLYLVVPPVSTPMIWRTLTGQPVTRSYVPITAIAPILPRTVMAAEDARFCEHGGIDWRSLRELLEEAEDLEDVRGGSTLTQQVAKNLFLWSGRSYLRKALEVPLSLWIDLILSKRRIMEIYLNIAEWGPNGEFGADAGSRRAFNKSARDIGPREAALLASMLPNPRTRDARRPGPGVQRLAGLYQSRSAAVDDKCLWPGRAP